MTAKSARALTEKAVRLRQAALFCWILGWVATATAVHQGLSNTFKFEWYYTAPVALISSFFLQRVFTSMESGITSGELPLPWKAGWTGQVCLPWVLAFVILFVDVLLNISAAYTILNNADVGGTALGMSAGQENGVRSFVLVIVAVVIALGSEILREWADLIDPSMQDETTAQLNEKVRQSNARPAPDQAQQQAISRKQQKQLEHQQRLQAARDQREEDQNGSEEEEDPRHGRSHRAHFRTRQQRHEASKG